MTATTSTLSRRHTALREVLASLGVDALVVVHGTNVRYLTNHAGSAGVLVVTGDALHLVLDSRYLAAMRQTQASDAACPQLTIHEVPTSYDEATVACLEEIGAVKIGFEAAHVTVARHGWWEAALRSRQPVMELVPTERAVEQLRVIKDAAEIATLREAARRLEAVAVAAFGAAHPGVVERDVALAIETALRAAGYERPSFETIVASGPNSALPHYHAGGRTLVEGDLLVLDFGGVLDGYCSDLTRTMAIGRPSAEGQRLHDAVFAAHQAAIAAIRPGADTAAVDGAARAILRDRGLGDAFGHGTGHGLGLDIHEEPRVGPPRPDAPAVTLEPGMVFTIEPGAYLPGFGGVRIEDDVLVTETGCEVLTTVRRDLLSVA